MSNQPNENEVVTGGLIDSTITSDINPPSQEGANTPSAESFTPAESTGFVHLGGKRFDSQAHLEAYVSQLERQAVSQSQTAQAPVAQVTSDDDFDFATEFYSDPNAAAKKLSDKVYRKAMTDFEKKQSAAQAWAEFYRRNPDLDKNREMVEFQYSKNRNVIDTQPLDQALETLAKETRSFLAKARGAPTGNGSEMPRGSVVSTGSSGNVAPKAPAAEAPKVLSFSEQVKQMQRGRRK